MPAYSGSMKISRSMRFLAAAVILTAACSQTGGDTQTTSTGVAGTDTTLAEQPAASSTTTEPVSIPRTTTSTEPVSTPRVTTTSTDAVLIVEVQPGSGIGEEAEATAEQWIGEFEPDSADMVGSVDTPAGRYDLLRYRSADGSDCVIAMRGDVGSGVCQTDHVEITQTLLDPFAEGLLVSPGEITKVTAYTVDGHEIVGFPRRGTIVMAWPVEWGEIVTLTAETPAGMVEVLPGG
ncbi:hypothetical protein BMS3Bbin01_00972 [bacterium BMS3Bbin01]|nr:hypothetical protein BMS3Bbin01_00972 [bacterium BMS3Bbin01]